MELSKKALDLIEKGILYVGEIDTNRNHKGIFLELNEDTFYEFKTDDKLNVILPVQIKGHCTGANVFPSTKEQLIKMMRAKHGIELVRIKRAVYAASIGENIATDCRLHYIPQYSLKSC
jgi:hypothetical protein